MLSTAQGHAIVAVTPQRSATKRGVKTKSACTNATLKC